MKIKGHTLGTWFNHLLFRLLPPRWYLRTQGVELRNEPNVVVTVTYRLPSDMLRCKKQASVRFINAEAVVKMVPLWFKYGFCEPIQFDDERYYIPANDILLIEWYDPILEDNISIAGLGIVYDGTSERCGTG